MHGGARKLWSIAEGSGPAGLGLAVAAIAVNAPRLILAFLKVDGLPIPAGLRASLLALTGISTGIVLTGGGAFLAHSVARGGRFRGLLGGTWLLVLTCGTALAAPMLIAGLSRESLDQVLPSSGLRWSWSAVAVLAVELVAAGAMVAHAKLADDNAQALELQEELLELARERNDLQTRLAEMERKEAEAQDSPPAVSAPAGEGSNLESPVVRRPGRRSRRRTPRRAARAGSALEGPVPCRNGCGFEGKSLMAECGHQKGCPARHRRRTRTARAGSNL